MLINSELVELSVALGLAGRKTTRIESARITEDKDKIKEYLKVISKISDRSEITVKENTLEFTPGSIRSGSFDIELKYNGIGEVIKHLLPVVGFSRGPMRIRFKGYTNSSHRNEPCVDVVKSVHCKISEEFGLVTDIRITKRSIFPSIDGEVLFLSEPLKSSLSPVKIDRREELERIVCVNYSTRIGSDILTRVTNTERDYLKKITPKIKVYNDIGNRTNSGATPGFGSVMLAYGKNSVYYSDSVSDGAATDAEGAPEKRTEKLVREFLRTIRKSGAYDEKVQNFVLVLLAFTSEDASAVLVSRIDREGREVLRLLESILKYTYTIEKHKKSKSEVDQGVSDSLYVVKSFGVGYSNIYRPTQ